MAERLNDLSRWKFMSNLQEQYFDLTNTKNGVFDLSIEKQDHFTCNLVDNKNNVYCGFILSKTPAGNNLTVCDISFQKSTTDKKYQARLTFRKTDPNLEDKKANSNTTHIRIPFSKGQEGYREFWQMIAFLYKWRETIDLGNFKDVFAITEKDYLAVLPAIAKLENREYVLKNLEKLSKEQLSNIDNLVNVTSIKSLLKEIKDNKNNYDEEFWQQKFQEYPWILSQIFSCPFIQIGKKFYCGGKEDDDRGGVKGDLIYKNEITGNIAFIEIKTPKENLIIGKQYRGDEDGKENIVYSMNSEITGGVNQVLNQKKIYLKTHGENKEKDKYLDNAKCILIIGITPKDRDEIKSFELYRNSMREVEIITYTELFARIKSILDIFEK